jgi:hypothetical protein
MDPLIFLVIASYILVFGIGFIAGKNMSPPTIIQSAHQPVISEVKTGYMPIPKSVETAPVVSRISKIEIDDRKFITEVKTDSLEKKFDDLGKTTVAKDEGLSANVSKLASLKKSKED